jgi:hypothetical protein
VLDSAKGWAATIRFNDKVLKQFQEFYNRPDTFSLGICNGCQLMALLGWVPATAAEGGVAAQLPDLQQPRFVHNTSGRYVLTLLECCLECCCHLYVYTLLLGVAVFPYAQVLACCAASQFPGLLLSYPVAVQSASCKRYRKVPMRPFVTHMQTMNDLIMCLHSLRLRVQV